MGRQVINTLNVLSAIKNLMWLLRILNGNTWPMQVKRMIIAESTIIMCFKK